MSDMERTEDATPQRRDEAHREGRVPRSQELNTAVLLVGSALVLNTAGVALGKSVFGVFGLGLVAAGASPLDAGASLALVLQIGWKMLGALALFLGAMGLVALAVAGAQGRGVLSAKPLEPSWERLDPVQNGKRLLGAQPWAELVKNLLKVAVVALAVHWALSAAWPEILALVQQPSIALLEVVRRYLVRLLLMAGGAYLVIGLADYVYQIWQHEKGLRMTKEDVRQEMKQGEVDPLIKQRMRSVARGRMRQQMFEQVPTADVVVTNPTHIAVALKYEQGKDVAPVVVAMGQEKVAEKIKRIAAESSVPLVENKPVARALLASAQVGSAIPQELYLAVIEIYAFVIRQRQGRSQGERSR